MVYIMLVTINSGLKWPVLLLFLLKLLNIDNSICFFFNQKFNFSMH